MKLKFWTPEETNRLTELVRTCKTKQEAFRTLSKETKRSTGCILQKYYSISGEGKRKPAKQSIQLPEGFEFNFVPKRATMQKNSVTLYF